MIHTKTRAGGRQQTSSRYDLKLFAGCVEQNRRDSLRLFAPHIQILLESCKTPLSERMSREKEPPASRNARADPFLSE